MPSGLVPISPNTMQGADWPARQPSDPQGRSKTQIHRRSMPNPASATRETQCLITSMDRPGYRANDNRRKGGGTQSRQRVISTGGNAMKRREFLKTAGAGLAASSTLAAPAVAQSMPELKWRCTTSWPKSLDVQRIGDDFEIRRGGDRQ